MDGAYSDLGMETSGNSSTENREAARGKGKYSGRKRPSLPSAKRGGGRRRLWLMLRGWGPKSAPEKARPIFISRSLKKNTSSKGPLPSSVSGKGAGKPPRDARVYKAKPILADRQKRQRRGDGSHFSPLLKDEKQNGEAGVAIAQQHLEKDKGRKIIR